MENRYAGGIELVLDDGGRTRLTASAGICISDGPMDFDSLYREADEALYQAKGDGGGTCRIRRSVGGVDPSARGHLDILAAMPMSSLLESMDSGIAMLDVSSQEPRITYASPALCRMLGIQDRRPVSASTPPCASHAHPTDRGCGGASVPPAWTERRTAGACSSRSAT